MTSKTRRPTTGAKRPARHESNSEKPYVSSFDEQLRAGNEWEVPQVDER